MELTYIPDNQMITSSSKKHQRQKENKLEECRVPLPHCTQIRVGLGCISAYCDILWGIGRSQGHSGQGEPVQSLSWDCSSHFWALWGGLWSKVRTGGVGGVEQLKIRISPGYGHTESCGLWGLGTFLWRDRKSAAGREFTWYGLPFCFRIKQRITVGGCE